MQNQSTVIVFGNRMLKKKKPVSAGLFSVLAKILLIGIFTMRCYTNLIVSEFPDYNQQSSSLNKSIYTEINHG